MYFHSPSSSRLNNKSKDLSIIMRNLSPPSQLPLDYNRHPAWLKTFPSCRLRVNYKIADSTIKVKGGKEREKLME